MSEEVDKQRFPILAKIGVAACGAILIWFVQYTMTTVSSLSDRLAQVEKADAQWGTLAELRENDIQRRIEAEVNRRLMKIILYHYKMDVDLMEPKENAPMEVPNPPAPEDVDPERFRQEQMKRYPSKGK